ARKEGRSRCSRPEEGKSCSLARRKEEGRRTHWREEGAVLERKEGVARCFREGKGGAVPAGKRKKDWRLAGEEGSGAVLRKEGGERAREKEGSRINVAFDNDARTLRCFLLAAECDSPHGLHAEAGFKVAAFRRGIQQVKHFLSAEDAESRYLRAYADSVCDPGEPRAMLLLHLGENCPECVAVQVKEQPSNESDWSSGSVGRRTMDDESCVIPFPVRSHVFPDCEWRADDNATFHDTVRNQSRWTCPVTTSYDADAIEIGASVPQLAR
ncbi:hypothetical protein CYMTET_33556, partial [Cymbomonas tetramitiformis]